MRIRFKNHYQCMNCGTEWEDEWDSTCDDECPECGTAMTPYKSDDIIDERFHKLAKKVFGKDGLTIKNSDRKDFAEIGKTTLADLLEEAYQMGVEDGKDELASMF